MLAQGPHFESSEGPPGASPGSCAVRGATRGLDFQSLHPSSSHLGDLSKSFDTPAPQSPSGNRLDSAPVSG